MSKVKNAVAVLVAFAIICVLCPITAFAAPEVAKDNHADTQDYCLRAYDVSIGLAELRACATVEDYQAMILDAANPRVLVRDETRDMSDWTKLDRAQLSADFSAFVMKENAEGYPVTLLAPAITNVQSSVTFLVYVIDNTPKPVLAVLHFAGTDIPDMTIDVTLGAVKIHFEDLPAPTQQGQIFSGWYLDEKGTIPFLLPNSEAYGEQSVTDGMNLYAKFEPIPTPDPTPEPTPAPTPDPDPAPTPEPTPGPDPTPVSPIERAQSVSASSALNEQAYEKPSASTQTPAQPERSVTANPQPFQSETESTMNNVSSPIASLPENDSTSLVSKEGPLIAPSLLLLVAMTAVTTVLYASILSDMQVLMWYHSKKEARRTQI